MYALDPQFLRRGFLDVALVGVGGTGGEVLSSLVHLHHALVAFGYDGLNVVAFDPDTVSLSNVTRQRFYAADIGANKAVCLVDRVNLSCGLAWDAVPERFSAAHGRHNWDIVISAVDTRRARRDLHKAAFASRLGSWKFWLDLGNDLTTGQACLGTPRPSRRRLQHSLPCATEMHPELMDITLPEDDTPSCSAIEALQRQDLFVNKMVATLGMDLLWQLLRHGQLDVNARYFNLAGSTLGARRIPAKPKRTRAA